jgi:hypothetical protein
MLDAKVALVNIVDKVPNTYNTNEGWVVKKMRSKYANKIIVILAIIYQKDKVQHFNNTFVMMIFRADHGESINLSYNYVFSIGQGIDQMEKMLKKHD